MNWRKIKNSVVTAVLIALSKKGITLEEAEKEINNLLEKQKKEERLRIIGELSEIIEKGITHEGSIELIYARLQSYILKALKGKE